MKFSLAILFLLTTPTAAFAAGALCSSDSGGHCLSLAAVSGAQIIAPGAEPGEAISQLYIWALGFVGFAAFLIFVIGGVRYMFTGDKDPTDAKKMMGNAAKGLGLALIAYLLLFTINPDLVRVRGPLIQPLSPEKNVEIKNVAPGGEVLPKQGFVEPGAAPSTPQGTCNEFHARIDGLCFGYVTNPPCSPPKFYTHVAGSCHLKCDRQMVAAGTCPLKTNLTK